MPPDRKPQILFVENDPVIRHIGAALLQRHGAVVTTASNGSEALKYLNGVWDLVLLECELPGLDGWETAKVWRSREKVRTKLVALSSGNNPAENSVALAAGVDEVLSKPLNAGKIATLLGQSSPASVSHTTHRFRTLLRDYKGFESVLASALSAFLSNWPVEREELTVASQHLDFAAVREIAHKLKGECLTFTLQCPAEFATQLEIQALAANGASVQKYSEELKLALNQELPGISALLEKIRP